MTAARPSDDVLAGGKLYSQHCAVCHGVDAGGRGRAPSLHSPSVQGMDDAALAQFLADGDLRKGMPSVSTAVAVGAIHPTTATSALMRPVVSYEIPAIGPPFDDRFLSIAGLTFLICSAGCTVAPKTLTPPFGAAPSFPMTSLS